MAYKDNLCPSGHYLPQSADPANEGRYAGRNRRCHACTAVAEEMERLKDNPHSRALLFGAALNRRRRVQA
jgi:hypothetical protein